MVDGYGKADIINGGSAARTGVFRVCNAYHFSIEIKQRAAGISGVDRAVCLDQLHGYAVGQGNLSVQGADRSRCQGKGQFPKGIPDSDHAVPYIQILRISDHNRCEPFRLHL